MLYLSVLLFQYSAKFIYNLSKITSLKGSMQDGKQFTYSKNLWKHLSKTWNWFLHIHKMFFTIRESLIFFIIWRFVKCFICFIYLLVVDAFLCQAVVSRLWWDSLHPQCLKLVHGAFLVKLQWSPAMACQDLYWKEFTNALMYLQIH